MLSIRRSAHSPKEATSGLGRTTTWSSYNKPSTITQGATTISFLDDPKHQRFQQITPQGTTLYFDSFGVHAEYVAGSNTWNEYLPVGNAMVGVRFLAVSTETLTLTTWSKAGVSETS